MKAACHDIIKDGLLHSGIIFKDKLDNLRLSEKQLLRLTNDYPDFEDLPICYFLKGIAYESDSQFEKARQAYQTFVDKYPDHYMADQTRKMIPLVGKSPEEMLDDILAAANDTIIAR